jgi:hypothetical protein
VEPISIEIIEKVMQRAEIMSPPHISKLFERVNKEQPSLVVYLMESNEDVLNGDEVQIGFFLGTLIWLMMSEGKLRLTEITEEMLITAEGQNLTWVEQLSNKKASAMTKVINNMLRDYSQPEMFQFIIETIKQEEDAGRIREANARILMMELKTVIDCFNTLQVGNQNHNQTN